MKLEFLSLLSTDKLKLPGLLYTPAHHTKKAAVWLHGMGDSGTFYNPERMNALGQALTDRNIALLIFNNRGAHNNKSLLIMDETLPEEERRYQAGTHYELIADCINDIEGAVNLLHERGFNELYLIGHSTGANKICVYNSLAKKNAFKKYVLAGPGDDSGIFFSELGQKKFWQALSHAQGLIKAGTPEKVMPRYSGLYPFSAQAAADILDPDGDYNTFPFYEYAHKRLGKKPLFAEYKKINRPVLVVFGEDDEYAFTGGGAAGALDILNKFTSPAMRKASGFEIIAAADHGFHGAEAQFADKVATWLAL